MKAVKKLVSKSEFARIAGVSAATITRRIKDELSAAVAGSKIDSNHPAAKSFIKNLPEKDKAPAPGIDPLYQAAVDYCQYHGKFTASSISRKLKIGYQRAQRILTMIQAAGIKPLSEEEKEKRKEPPPLVKGVASKNKTKKQHSLKALNKKLDESENETVDSETLIHEVPEDILAFADMTLRELIQRFGTEVAFNDWLKAVKQIEDINEKRLKNAATQGELVSRELVKIAIIDPINTVHTRLLMNGSKTIALRLTAMVSAKRTLKECEDFVAERITSFIKPMKDKIKRSYSNLNKGE